MTAAAPALAPVPAPPRALAVALLGVIFLLVGAFGGVQPQWYLPCYAALFVLAGIAFVQSSFRFRWVDAFLVLLLSLPLFQLAFHLTASRAATEATFLHWMAAAAVFWAARHACPVGLLSPVLATAAGLLGLAAIAQLFLTPQDVFGLFHVRTAVPMGSFVDRDDFAACMNLFLPFALWMSASSRRTLAARDTGWTDALWWALAAGLALAALLLSASRGGALVAAAEIVAFAVWQLARVQAKSLLVAAAAVLLVGAFCYTVGFNVLLSRFGQEGVSDAARMNFIRSGLSMGVNRPLLGYGVGAWESVYPRYARFDDGSRVETAHSEYAQLFAETGFVGLACLVALGIVYGCALRRPSVPALIALAGFVIHAGFEFVFHIPALLLLFALIAGAALSAPSRLRPAGPSILGSRSGLTQGRMPAHRAL